jgi:CDP-diacylglycerol---glycerol-3-phosphate 3-phosphatidyltransferase
MQSGRPRQMKLTTAFGAFLDPVADKIMVTTSLLLLAMQPPEPLAQAAVAIPSIIIISREITMSSLREWASASGGGAHKVCDAPRRLAEAWVVSHRVKS